MLVEPVVLLAPLPAGGIQASQSWLHAADPHTTAEARSSPAIRCWGVGDCKLMHMGLSRKAARFGAAGAQ